VNARWLVVAGVAAFAPSAARAVEPLRVCADPNDLPFSNAAGEGFENKIAEMIAVELRRPLQYVWRAERRGFLRDGINSGACDLVTAVPLGVDYRKDDPAADIVRAVADREIDVAAVWGPVAGYFAERQSPPLVVTPLADQGTARIPMVFDIAMGVRKRDDDLKQAVQAALDALKPRIDETLRQYGVPIVTSDGTQ